MNNGHNGYSRFNRGAEKRYRIHHSHSLLTCDPTSYQSSPARQVFETFGALFYSLSFSVEDFSTPELHTVLGMACLDRLYSYSTKYQIDCRKRYVGTVGSHIKKRII
jgi:hypothetical protein